MPMSPSSPERPDLPSRSVIPEERALAALRRAAQLQAEAAERQEKHTRALAAHRPGDPGESGFRRADIEAAAEEAGISPEYVRQALQEQDTLGEHAVALPPWMEGMGRRFLGTRQQSLEIVREIEAEPHVVLEAMQRVFPAPPYEMTLMDSLGGSPLEGGALVFQVPRMSWGSMSYTPFEYAMTMCDITQLHTSLQPVRRTERTSTVLTLRVDMRLGIRRNVWAGLGVSGAMGAGGMAAGVAVGVAAGALAPLLVAGAALGAVGVGGLGVAGYGAIYRYYHRKAIRELEMLLRVVDASARTGGSFRSPLPGANPTPPGALPPFTSS